MTDKTIVAVYGSLRQGLGNHRLLDNEGVEFLGRGETVSKASMVSMGSFPAITQPSSEGGDYPIVVEVYAVDEPTFKNLDRLGGYPNFYNREEVQVVMSEKRIVNANIYFISEVTDGRHTLEHGDWMLHLREEGRYV